MPVQGVGIWWVIEVPMEHAETAIDVINSLPLEVTVNPGVWGCGPSKGSKQYWKIYAYIVFFSMVLTLVVWIVQFMTE